MEKNKNTSSTTWALILFTIGVFMAALDNGIVSAALQTINTSFDVPDNWGAWGVTIYTLGLAISVPIVGKLSDKYGRKKLFIIEISLFALGSFLIAISPNFTFYLISRFIQAMGGGGIFIIGSSYVLSTFPLEKQGKALGLLGAMNGVGAVLGPNIGSFILDLTGNWHYLFLINVPIAIVLVLLGIFKIKESKEPSSKKLDFFGTVLLSFAILGIMYGITNLDGVNLVESFMQPEVYGFILAGVLVFIALLFHEKRLEGKGGDPILPFTLLSKAPYLVTLLIGSLSGALLASMIFVPSFASTILGISESSSGYWMTPLALASGVGAALGGVLADKKGPVFAVAVSGIISFVGFLLFAEWANDGFSFIIASIVAGCGIGVLLGAPLNMLATEKTQNAKGSSLATLSLMRTIGMTLAPTIFAGFLARSYNKVPDLFETEFPDVLQKNLEAAGIDESQMAMAEQMAQSTSGMDMNSLMASIEKIPDEGIRNVIEQSVSDITTMAGQSGFSLMYVSAAVMAALILILVPILSKVRK